MGFTESDYYTGVLNREGWLIGRGHLFRHLRHIHIYMEGGIGIIFNRTAKNH